MCLQCLMALLAEHVLVGGLDHGEVFCKDDPGPGPVPDPDPDAAWDRDERPKIKRWCGLEDEGEGREGREGEERG